MNFEFKLKMLSIPPLLLFLSSVAAFFPEFTPKYRDDLSSRLKVLETPLNVTGPAFFKILSKSDEIVVGARNQLFTIKPDFTAQSLYSWSSTDADRELCTLKGKTAVQCQNYLRVFVKGDGEKKNLICGTNSYKPRCRYVDFSNSEEQIDDVKEVEAQGISPYDPIQNYTYIYADGQLYSATVADFSGSDPLIFREPLRTEQYDLNQLNQPNFVASVDFDPYVLFFFREVSASSVLSRVARVCKNDRGGKYAFSTRWTSFLKSRLNCSVAGDFPFYFDEIQSTARSGGTIYAVFTTPENSIAGSAVCIFRFEDIVEIFEGVSECIEDSRTLSTKAVNFVKTHSLMEHAIQPVGNRPLLVKTGSYRFTTIAVDQEVKTVDGQVDVIFVGTSDGKVLKFHTSSLTPVVVSETQVFSSRIPIREIIVSSQTQTLTVFSDHKIVSVPIQRCAELPCKKCVQRQDPYCAWDVTKHECVAIALQEKKGVFYQDLKGGAGGASLCKSESNKVFHGVAPKNLQDRNYTELEIEQENQIKPLLNDSHRRIVLSSISSSDLEQTLEDSEAYELQIPATRDIKEASLNWIFVCLAFFLIFTFGICIGYYLSVKNCQKFPLVLDNRNDFNMKPASFHHNNLLKKPNADVFSYPTKLDNLKNLNKMDDNTLEKETHLKTLTLKKVKKTYI